MTVQQTGEGTRKLYKILRGSYSRREGDVQPFVDPETGRPTKRRSRPFVHYSAKSMRNPSARDEIYLTDREVRSFAPSDGTGLHLRELHPEDVRTIDPDTVDEMLERALPVELSGRVKMLIEEGQQIRRNAQLKVWRKRVFEAQVLVGPMPTKRLDILDALGRITG